MLFLSTEISSEQSYEDIDDITRNETASGVSLTGAYETPQDYIDALDANGEWVAYAIEWRTRGGT